MSNDLIQENFDNFFIHARSSPYLNDGGRLRIKSAVVVPTLDLGLSFVQFNLEGPNGEDFEMRLATNQVHLLAKSIEDFTAALEKDLSDG